jgi:pilus assembly protein FimV
VATAKEKLIASAQKLVEKGAFEKAIKEYLRVVQEDDADVRIWLKIGDLYAKIGKKPEATETYQRVAQFYSDQGFYLKSVAVYKQILKLEPRLVDVNQRLAELYKQLGLISDAIHQYEQVAGFFHKEGRVRDALAAMKQIVELDPETVAARIKLAEMYSRENMPREAIDEFTRAAEQLKEQGRVDEYMKVAERLLFHAPDNRPVTKELARLYIEKNDPRRALPKLQVLFKADARDLDVLRLLARAFEGLEQRPKAVSVYKELARILTEQGDNKGAQEVFQQILAIEPDDADAQAALKGRRTTGSGVRGRKLTPPPLPSEPSRQALTAGGIPSRAYATGAERALDSGGSRSLVPPVVRDQPTVRPGTLPTRDGLIADPDASDDVLNEEVAKILSETDVYIKYNLHAKAIEHLQRVFERAPRHIGAREKLKALYITTGKRDEAVLELWALAEAADPARSRRYIREIYELDPHNARAAEMLGEPIGGRGTAPSSQAADDFSVDAPSEFGLPRAQAEPPTRRARGLSAEPVDEIAIEDESAIEASDADLIEEVADLDPVAFDDLPADDDLIPVVVDTGAQRAIADSVSPEDSDRFSLDEAEPNVPTFQGATPRFDSTADADAETRFAGGPRGVQAPMTFDAAGEGTSTAPSTGVDDDFSSFDDPSRTDMPARPLVTSDAIELDPSTDPSPPSTGSRRGPPPAPIPDPLSAQSGLEDDLDESDFFMQQNLFEEARSMLSSLLERFPEHPLVLAKLRDLEAAEQGVATAGAPALEPIQTDSALTATPPPDLPGEGEIHAVRSETANGEPIEVTKKGVIERGVSAEDFETHYDLGIAYKEMGLIDDAVAEFRIVMKDPAREVQCLLMIGLCYLEKQMFTEAINQFKKGLYVEGITEAEELSLYYELGQGYEKIGDPREALYYYDKVQKRDPKFRDLARRLRALRGDDAVSEPTKRSEDVDSAFDSLLEET